MRLKSVNNKAYCLGDAGRGDVKTHHEPQQLSDGAHPCLVQSSTENAKLCLISISTAHASIVGNGSTNLAYQLIKASYSNDTNLYILIWAPLVWDKIMNDKQQSVNVKLTQIWYEPIVMLHISR